MIWLLNSWHWELFYTHVHFMKYLQPVQKRGRKRRGSTLCWNLLQRPKFPVWITTSVCKGAAGPVQNVSLVQRCLGSVKSLLTLKWTRRFYLRQLVTFSLFSHWWPWIHWSLLVCGYQRLQREHCEHFGFAADHLTLGRPACGLL